jgi:hypothetical protein
MSLEGVSKNGADPTLHGKITYLPSLNRGNDGNILRLRDKNPDIYRKVVSGRVSIPDALREAGVGSARDNQGRLGRAMYIVRNMTAKERREFVEWLKTEGII